NPPYMGSRGMNKNLNQFISKQYPLSKSDLFSVFMERCQIFTQDNGFYSMITQQSWMFLSSYEELRDKIVLKDTIINMLHLGAGAFTGDDVGTIVQSVSFVIAHTDISKYDSTYIRLIN